MSSSITDNAAAHVLYVDHEGHAAPLTMCFHATASRRISSCIDDKHPPSTRTEIDSAFCPQCLSFHDAATAASLGYCPKDSCKLCPLCTSVASVCILDGQAFYKCGYCDYNSKEVGNIVVPVAGTTIGKEQIAKAKADLGAALKERQSTTDAETRYSERLKILEEKAKTEVKRSKSRGGLLLKKTTKKSSAAWSIEALEDSMRTKQEAYFEASSNAQSKHRSIVESDKSDLDDYLANVSRNVAALQLSSPQIRSKDDLLPLPIPLRPRKSRRCRAELAEGRPGILMKPKLNPLEGDTSLRSGHGQFWKKDSSAIQVIPIITVLKTSTPDDGTVSFLLKVQNPTLGDVKLRLGPSTYGGEPTWDGKERDVHLKHVCISALSGRRLDATLTMKTSEWSATDWVSVEPVIDAFLELGGVPKDPDSVRDWDGSGSSAVGLTLVAQQGDHAWFQLTTAKDTTNSPNPSVPISLQVQVGDGSWESSLIKPKKEGEGPDVVSFDVVIVYEQ